jgi:hypothetical protein
MDGAMATDATRAPTLTKNLRILCALTAILTIFNTTPWSQSTRLQLALGFAGALAWGTLALFGNKPGWSRLMALVALTAFVVLSLWRLAGVAV